MSAITHQDYPALSPDRREIDAPVDEVTLLEDRAQITRQATLTLEAGTHRLAVRHIAPTLQDVSARGEVRAGGARVIDASVHRAVRVKSAHQPKAWAEAQDALAQLQRDHTRLERARERALQQREKILTMLKHGARELPQDVAWGSGDLQDWRDSFASLCERARELDQLALSHTHSMEDIAREAMRESARLEAMDSPEQHLAAWITIDLAVDEPGPITLAVHYTSPNAMWRPAHIAALSGDTLTFISQAAVWQRTGEDWEDAKLVFSTARTSLGIDPPYLHDDLLRVQRRQEHTTLSFREVDVQTAGGGAAAPQPSGVELPGVDDGGDIQRLRPEGLHTLRSDGQANLVELSRVALKADVTAILMAELEPAVLIRSSQAHTGAQPILAGPVSLIRDAGPVGQTQTLFVAPGERFELGFGPHESMRAVRHTQERSDRVDPVDRWRRKVQHTTLFLSNLEDQPQRLVVTERIPVSEVEHARVTIIEQETTQGYTLDAHGMVSWEIALEGYGQKTLNLRWELALAPDVNL